MKRCKCLILIILFAFSMPYIYGGCVVVFSSGNLNRDKEKIDDETSGGFSGSTSQAAITPMNAEALAIGAFAGGVTSVEHKSYKLNRSSNAVQMDVFRPLRFPLVLGNSLRKIELDPAQFIFSQTNVITESNNLEGTCSGDFSYTLNLNRLSETFSGNLLFSDYCDDGIIISGETDVDGTFDVSSGDFTTAIFSFDDLSDSSNALDGEISIDFSDTPIFATFTTYSKDEHNGQVCWMKDYSVNLSQFVGQVEIEIFGTFYHPDEGFVTLTTSEPFVVFNEDDWPASGQLVIEGDDNTYAQLIVIDQLHYRIEADTEGNGIFDWDSGILNWTDM